MEGVAVVPLLGVKSRRRERRWVSFLVRVSETAISGRAREQWLQVQGKPQCVWM